MSNENCQSPEDEFAVYAGIKFNRKTLAVAGVYRDGIFVEKRRMTLEEQSRAHDVVKKHIFESKHGG